MTTRRFLTLILIGAVALTTGIGRPGAASDPTALRAGFASTSITPPEEMWGEVRHTSRRHPTGVLDPLTARAAFVADGDTSLAVVAVDLLGLFHDDVVLIRDEVRRRLGDDVQVVVASTHTHSSIDTLGIYGPDETTSGLHPPYQELVRSRTVEAIVEAATAAVPASLVVAEAEAPDGLNEYDINRTPGSFDDGVRGLRFEDADGVAIGTIVNWASHPELIDPRSSSDPGIPEAIRGAIISSDLVHTLRETVEANGGGTTVFLNGPIGAVTGLAMPIPDPASGGVFPRRSVAKAYHVGTEVGRTVVDALASPDAIEVDTPELAHRAITFDLRVENPFILALKAAGVIDRQTYEAGVPTPFGRDVRTEMARVDLGPVRFVTVPGELHPDVYTGVYLPRHERANPDVPGERPIRPQMDSPIRFLVGLAQDELGYFVSATDFVAPSTVSPVYGEGVDQHGRDHYQETLSLGRDTARSIGQIASMLLGHEPEADYAPYPGGFLDADGRPLYHRPTHDPEVRGIWIDTSGSGRFERGQDAELHAPFPTGAPAGFGFLDAFGRDMGAEPTPAARGVWLDGDGDGAYSAFADPHLFVDSYHVGPGEPRP